MIEPHVDTITPLWSWLAGLVFAIGSILIAARLQRRTDHSDGVDELVAQQRDRARVETRDV